VSELTKEERAVLLEPCACGHDFEVHGTLAGCWTCEDENAECKATFKSLLCERVAEIVAARLVPVEALAAEWSRQYRRDFHDGKQEAARELRAALTAASEPGRGADAGQVASEGGEGDE
jgi:hypothetical protein